MLILDVRERQDTAKELATAHDTPEARESEQKPRSHTTVNVDQARIIRYNVARTYEDGSVTRNFYCRFYFPGGKPLPLSQVEATVARITAAFQTLPGHRASRAQFHTVTKVKNSYLVVYSSRVEKKISRATILLVWSFSVLTCLRFDPDHSRALSRGP